LEDAQFEASEDETSRPSGAIVARSCVPRPRDVDAGALMEELVEGTEPAPGVKGKAELLLETLDGVAGGREEGPVSINVPLSAKSSLFPTRIHVRFGEARARASFMKEGRAVKVP
jgi:hypothetical protein